MKKSRNRILSLSIFGVAAIAITVMLTGAGYSFPEKWNDFIRNMDEQLKSYVSYMPEDRVYLQLDKPFYNPGDDVWFSAYVREGVKMKPSKQSDLVHVELINPKGNIEKEITVLAKEGQAAGDFKIGEELPGGIYKIKAWTQWQKNKSQAPFFEKEFQVQKVALPRLKMNLDFDRKAFGPGDLVEATLKLETNANQPLSQHDFRIVANIEGKQVLAKAATTANDGEAKVSFNLPEELTTTDGLVNIMIEYNGLTESISRAIPIVLNQIDMEFFPEGGDLVEAMSGRVAFRALNEFKKPADIEGRVLDSRGNVVTTFSSYHQGLGAFDFIPQRGESYIAEITRPEGIAKQFDLPAALPKGYVLKVEDQDEDMVKLNILSSEASSVNIVVQVRGKMYWATEALVQPGNNVVRIPADRLPVGVAQISLFDNRGIGRAERLAFVNKNKGMKVSVETNKDKYLPREKVKMSVKVTDDRGWPMPAQLSLSVVNDQLLSFADDKSGNILSKMLLEYDIQDKVTEPSFYFDKKEEKATAALDLLLMTSGWRRFTWSDVVSGTRPSIQYPGERADISGIVYNGWTGQPVKGASISGKGWGVLTTKEGKFTIEGLDVSEAQSGTIRANGFEDQTVVFNHYGENFSMHIYPRNNRDVAVLEDAEEEVAMDFDMVAPPEPLMVDAVENVKMLENAEVLDQVVAFKAPKRAERVRSKGRKNAVATGMAAPVEMNRAAPVAERLPEQDLLKKKEEKKDRADNAFDNKDAFGDDMDMNDMKNIPGKADKMVAGEVGAGFFKALAQNEIAANQPINQTVIYRAREFAAPVYADDQQGEAPNVELRNDFRSTLFWNPNLTVGRNGTAEVEFYTSDEITSFNTIVEGISLDGNIGRGEKKIFTQLPFSMDAKAPVEVAVEDVIKIPVILTNNTDQTLTGALTSTTPEGLSAIKQLPSTVSIPAGQTLTLFAEYTAETATDIANLDIQFSSQGHRDAFRKELEITSKGYPVNISFSGQESGEKYGFEMNNLVNKSIKASFTAYPSVVTDLLKGIESILREPYGCFEQTSSSSYPNVLVMNYLNTMENPSPEVMERASGLMERGYARLTTFETSQKGYEWFGQLPAHEGLTAYGLMQFNEMKNHSSKVDEKMIDRTAKWLLSRRDGNGAFKVSERFLHTWLTDVNITSAYCVYALSEVGYSDIEPEIKRAIAQAKSTKDPYQLALVANALYNFDRTAEANEMVKLLKSTQAKDGSFTGTKFSVVCSKGQSLKVETTGLALQAMIKGGNGNTSEINNAVKFLQNSRSGSGGFGNTQATVLALKGLTEYAAFSKKTDESGKIEIWVDGKNVAEFEYEAGRREPIEITGLEKHLSGGAHSVEVRYPGVKNPLPWSIAVDYYTYLPQTSEQCELALETSLAKPSAKVGETLRLSAKLKNLTNEGVASPMAVIGLPAGLSAQPWQLKEMQEKGVFDYYEIIGNKLVCYYRDLKPSETREINLDLKAEIAGAYDAPASIAYLYYTPEHKFWTALPSVEVTN